MLTGATLSLSMMSKVWENVIIDYVMTNGHFFFAATSMVYPT